MKAYLQGESKRLFINPAALVPDEVTKTADSDIESPNGKPLVIYRDEKVEIHVTKESFEKGKAKVHGLMGIENYGRIERKASNTEAEVNLKDYPEIAKLYASLL